MAECSKCGKQEMTFNCRYCNEKFCSEHRLPENHDCGGLEDAKTKSAEDDKWFVEKDTSTRSKKTPREPSLFRDIKRTLLNNVTLAIIAITVFSFLLQLIPGYSEVMSLSPALTDQAVQMTNQAANNLGYGNVLPSSFIEKPWSIFTVMFVHAEGLFHIFANMVTLYFFGTVLERKIGSKDFLKFYLVSGLIASVGYLVFRNVLFQIHGPILGSLPTLMPAVGASGAVVAVFGAVAMLYPDAEVLLYFFIPMKIQTALYIFTGFEILNLTMIAAGMPLPFFGNLASDVHLIGLICGVYFGRRIRDRVNSRPGVIELLG